MDRVPYFLHPYRTPLRPFARINRILTAGIYSTIYRRWTQEKPEDPWEVYLGKFLLRSWRRWVLQAVRYKNQFYCRKDQLDKGYAARPLDAPADRSKPPVSGDPLWMLTSPRRFLTIYNCVPAGVWVNYKKDRKHSPVACQTRPCPFCHFRRTRARVKRWLKTCGKLLRQEPLTLRWYQADLPVTESESDGLDELAAAVQLSKKVLSRLQRGGALASARSLQPVFSYDLSALRWRLRWLILTPGVWAGKAPAGTYLAGTAPATAKRLVHRAGRLLSRAPATLAFGALPQHVWNLLNHTGVSDAADLGLWAGRDPPAPPRKSASPFRKSASRAEVSGPAR